MCATTRPRSRSWRCGITDVEAEDFINLRNDKLKRLERTIHDTFRGKGVNPYVYNIYPEYVPDPYEDNAYYRPPIKSGSIVQIGTQSHFHPNVLSLVNGLRANPDYCSQSAIIPLNKHFRNAFNVDWCQFSVRNVTLLKGFVPPSSAVSPSAPARWPDDGTNERYPLLTPRSSVGKQTVGEAALATGSSLNLYRNPLDIEDEQDDRNDYR
ncbi:hypothetical protein M3Y99_00405100 [Aphelenchoides fujianensis]|nr:hypothetical protein M3Y99_00405100 [Aphelenchoides fujianensis]